MANYTSQSLIEAFLQRSLTADEVTLLTTANPAVKLWIDRYLNSRFDSVSATTRYFESCESVLDIDPCQSITSVQSLDSDQTAYYTYTTSDYIAEPINQDVKTELRLRYSKWPKGAENIGVTAKFTEYDYTNSCVPYDIQVVATRIIAGIINAGTEAAAGGNVVREELEGHKIEYDVSSSAMSALADSDPIIKNLLASRKEVLIW